MYTSQHRVARSTRSLPSSPYAGGIEVGPARRPTQLYVDRVVQQDDITLGECLPSTSTVAAVLRHQSRKDNALYFTTKHGLLAHRQNLKAPRFEETMVSTATDAMAGPSFNSNIQFVGKRRSRASSLQVMQNRKSSLCSQHCALKRVRSFAITSRGIVNHGDLLLPRRYVIIMCALFYRNKFLKL